MKDEHRRFSLFSITCFFSELRVRRRVEVDKKRKGNKWNPEMGKDKEQEADLRKEVEMTEHKDSIEKVAEQFDLDLAKGLSEEQVLEVRSYILRVVIRDGDVFR